MHEYRHNYSTELAELIGMYILGESFNLAFSYITHNSWHVLHFSSIQTIQQLERIIEQYGQLSEKAFLLSWFLYLIYIWTLFLSVWRLKSPVDRIWVTEGLTSDPIVKVVEQMFMLAN